MVHVDILKVQQVLVTNPQLASHGFHAGNTTVLVAVYGPSEVKSQNELLDKAYLQVQFRPRDGIYQDHS